MSVAWLYIRLAFALALILAPGAAVARSLGVRGMSATLAWALTALAAAMGVTYLIHAPLALTLVLLLGTGAVALGLGRRRPARVHHSLALGSPGALAVGLLLGWMLWHVAGEIGGDGFFHLARTRKLLEFGDLSLSSTNEFPDGGLHPGYAFPLWHGLLALVAKIAGTDPTNVVLHLPSLLAPVAVLVWVEAGWAVFRRRVAALATAGAAVTITAFAPGHGGAYTALALPATSSRQLLVPALLALAFTAVRRPGRGTLASTAAAALALAIVHPTYVVFVWIPFVGFLLVRLLWTRRDALGGALTLAAMVGPAGLFIALLLPTVGDTVSVTPTAEERARAFRQYLGQLDVNGPDSFSVVPELFGRSGAVAVAALLLLPLAALAARRRWGAFVVGGALAVAAVTLLPLVFVPFSDLVSISQARRLVGFTPFPFAVAGGVAVLAALIGRAAAPLALAGAIALELLYAGDFDYRLTDRGPAWATWVAVAGALVALGAGRLRRAPLERSAALASALVLAPTIVGGLTQWSPSPARAPSPLSAGLVESLRDEVPVGAIVYADPEASYRIAAVVPVLICVAPPAHVADTVQNRPRRRIADFRRFVRTADVEIARACGAEWLVVDRDRFPGIDPGRGAAVYRDARWTVFRIDVGPG